MELRIKELEKEIENPNLWNDKDNAEKVLKELNDSKKQIEGIKNIKEKVFNYNNMLNDKPEILELIKNEVDEIEKE